MKKPLTGKTCNTCGQHFHCEGDKIFVPCPRCSSRDTYTIICFCDNKTQEEQ
jgi:hypothetical protein